MITVESVGIYRRHRKSDIYHTCEAGTINTSICIESHSIAVSLLMHVRPQCICNCFDLGWGSCLRVRLHFWICTHLRVSSIRTYLRVSSEPICRHLQKQCSDMGSDMIHHHQTIWVERLGNALQCAALFPHVMNDVPTTEHNTRL